MDLTECKKGNHLLEVITTRIVERNTPPDQRVYETVRWCSVCGAVVIDQDYDGRTNAGMYMKMRVPEASRGN